MKKIACAAMAALAIAVAPVFGAHAEEAKAEKVTLKGTNVCLIGAYGSEEDKSADTEHGPCTALKVTEATNADGAAVEGLEGKIIHYLPTAGAKSLQAKDAVGKGVTVTGALHKDASLVVVETVEGLGGGDDEWDELPSNSLSGQPVF